MRTTKRSGKDERLILTSMITDKKVLGIIASRWTEEGLFSSKWANVIGRWCCRYYDQYGDAPGSTITPIFESWASRHIDDDSVGIIEKFLVGLSDEFEQAQDANSDFVIDTAGKYFNEVKVRKLIDQLEGDASIGEHDKAIERISEFNRIEIGGSSAVEVFTDMESVRNAFETYGESIIDHPGALGEFYHNALGRDCFVAYLAPEKGGKTWQLIDIGWRAALQRKRVAFFEVGDMSQNQIMRRFMIRAAKRPFRAKTVKYPVSMIIAEGEQLMVEFAEKEFEHPLSWRTAWESLQKISKQKIRSKDSYLRLSVHPNDSINVSGIYSILQQWIRDGWVPDVVVIDYADILAPLPGSRDERDQINKTWKALRSLSQKLHCLVITATQADAASYHQDTVTKKNFSNDKRILAHVTGMIGISSNAQERDMGLKRLNWLVLRESNFPENRHCQIAGCLDVGNPCLLSELRFFHTRKES